MSAIAPEIPEVDLDALEHRYIGPTWQKDEKGRFIRPKHTLGFQIAGWCKKYLRNPQNMDEPFQFTPEQFRFVCWWYAVDENGRFIYQRGVLQRMKGWGKDPLLAVISLVEFVGPCRFDHWDEKGNPVAVPHPNAVVQLAAVAADQTTNTSDMFLVLASDKLKADYDITFGVELSRANGGLSKMLNLVSNPQKLEGNRPTFVLLNETQEWFKSNKGHAMYNVIDGNVSKLGNRSLVICNAYVPGKGSISETIRSQYERILEGKSRDLGWLYDSVEADEDTPLTPDALEHVIPILRGDSWWVKPEGAIANALNGAVPASEARRKWLNQIVASDDALLTPKMWDSMEVEEDYQLVDGDEIVLGFDGSKTEDATALVAIRISDRTIVPLLIEEKPEGWDEDLYGRWEVDKAAVDRFVRSIFRRYKVKAFFCDVNQWESYISDWSRDFGPNLVASPDARFACAFDMRRAKMATEAHQLLLADLERGVFRHAGMKTDNSVRLRQHALAALRDENAHGVYFRKDLRSRIAMIDAYAALTLANAALNQYSQKKKPDFKPARVHMFS